MVIAKVAHNQHHKALVKLAPFFTNSGCSDSGLHWGNGRLELIVRENGVHLQLSWEAECKDEGAATFNAEATRQLLVALKEVRGGFELHDIDGGAVRLQWDGGQLELRAVQGEIDARAFPATCVATFGARAAEVLYTVSKFTRPGWDNIFAYVMAERNNRGVVLVASDNYRLAVEWVDGCQLFADRVLVPAELIQLVSRLGVRELSYHQAPPTQGIARGLVAGDIRIWGQYRGGDFPDWRRPIPLHKGAALQLAPAALMQALKVVKASGVDDVFLQPDGNRVLLQAWKQKECLSTAAVQLEEATEFPRLRLDIGLLSGILKALSKCSTVEVRIYRDDMPVVFVAENGRRVYLLMPMRQD